MRDVSRLFPQLSRRGFLIAGGVAGIASKAGIAAIPGCTLTSEQEEGPYYLEDELLRRDITEGRLGVPLRLVVRLVDAKTCAPLRNAALDIWHCDAQGVYSGFTAQGGGDQDLHRSLRVAVSVREYLRLPVLAAGGVACCRVPGSLIQ